MEYHLTEVTRYAVNCEGCGAGTGNHSQQETAQKAAEKKGFIAIVTPEDGTINLCPDCIPEAVSGLIQHVSFKSADDADKPTDVPAKADDVRPADDEDDNTPLYAPRDDGE